MGGYLLLEHNLALSSPPHALVYLVGADVLKTSTTQIYYGGYRNNIDPVSDQGIMWRLLDTKILISRWPQDIGDYYYVRAMIWLLPEPPA